MFPAFCGAALSCCLRNFALKFLFVSSFQPRSFHTEVYSSKYRVSVATGHSKTRVIFLLHNCAKYSFKPPENVVATIRRKRKKKPTRADTLTVNLLTSSQINSQVSPVWVPLSCWSLGDREEVVSSGLCVLLRAEMKLHRQCFVCCHAELYLHPKLLWLLGLCCCLTTHPISPTLREASEFLTLL